jgi:hypothetical protein
MPPQSKNDVKSLVSTNKDKKQEFTQIEVGIQVKIGRKFGLVSQIFRNAMGVVELRTIR